MVKSSIALPYGLEARFRKHLLHCSQAFVLVGNGKVHAVLLGVFFIDVLALEASGHNQARLQGRGVVGNGELTNSRVVDSRSQSPTETLVVQGFLHGVDHEHGHGARCKVRRLVEPGMHAALTPNAGHEAHRSIEVTRGESDGVGIVALVDGVNHVLRSGELAIV